MVARREVAKRVEEVLREGLQGPDRGGEEAVRLSEQVGRDVTKRVEEAVRRVQGEAVREFEDLDSTREEVVERAQAAFEREVAGGAEAAEEGGVSAGILEAMKVVERILAQGLQEAVAGPRDGGEEEGVSIILHL
jgi:hypothetical protein